MAFSSFTLRKQTVELGSATRAAADDTALRSDGLVTTGIAVTDDNTFTANIISEGTVRLEWGITEPLVAKNSIASGFDPVQLIILASSTGEPVTVNDGLVVDRIFSTTPYTFLDHEPAVPQGRWVYYSLFVEYSTGTDSWYERVASLYIQIPTQYNSTSNLWKRIPIYYRELDYMQDELSSGKTPLYTFLDLIGDEIDRTRTLIDSVALSNDPEIASASALRELAKETGLEITLEDLGTSKARTLMDNIGSLRRTKGSIPNIGSYISALTGCRVWYEYDGTDPKPHIFHIHAQRSNFVVDPNFRTLANSSAYGQVNNGTTNYQATVQQAASAWGVYTYGSDSMGASVFPTITNSLANSGITVTLPAGSYQNRTVLVYGRTPFPYLEDVVYGSSFDFGASAGASFNNFHTTLNTTKQTWESGVSSASMPAQLFYDSSWNTGASFAPKSSSTRYSLDYSNNTGASASAQVVPVLKFTMTPGSSIFVGRWLVEDAVDGAYFSGDTREGGYIPVNTGAAGSGSFDYFWKDGADDNGYSFFVNDRERSVKTTERVLDNYVIPVTMLNYYQLDWNYYPGK